MTTTLNYEITDLNDIEAIAATPFLERSLPNSTYELIEQAAHKYQDKVALRFLPAATLEEQSLTFSYQQLFSQVTKTANAFHQLGVEKHDVVAMLLPNLPQAHFTIWGAEAAGIFSPINPLLEVEHIASIMNEAKVKVLVTVAPSLNQELWQKAQALKERVSSLNYIVTVAMDQQDAHLSNFVLDFNTLTAKQPGDTLISQRQFNRDDVASLFHTGGTTGTPKLAPHSHENEIACCFQIVAAAQLDTHSVCFCGLPVFHVNAVFITGLAPWLSGGEVILGTATGYRTPAVISNFWALVEKYKISFFSAVPTILSGLLEAPTKGYDLSSLDVALCGAAPLPTELMRRFENQTGIRLLEAYGQTEGTVGTSCNPKFGERKIGSVGLPLPYVQIKIAEVDENGKLTKECQTNESGCVLIKGATVFKGYSKPEQNIGQWAADGWFNTGDLGRLDEQGYLWLTGRSKDLIIRGGHNIDPQMIEEAFFKHPDVVEAVAVGKPDKRLGELPAVYIQLKQGSSVNTEQLLSHAKTHIHERAAIPKDIFIAEQVPLTAVGKVFKPTLRNQLTKMVVEVDLKACTSNTFSVEVEQDKKYGQCVSVQCHKHDENKVSAQLSDYTFKLRINL